MGTTTKTSAEYADIPIVQSHLRQSSEMLGQKVMVRHLESMDGLMRVKINTFDSPLEVLFWVWWSALESVNQFYPYECITLEHNVPVEAGGESYRLDFVVRFNEPRWHKAIEAGLLVWPNIAVELDGHAFHERTPEQVRRRDSRDRNLQQARWLVFHYSWSEFTTQPQRCAEEVYNLATTTVIELYRKFHQDVPSEFHEQVDLPPGFGQQ